MSCHETVLVTPEPSAWSTETKTNSKQSYKMPLATKNDVKRNLYSSVNTSSESLGILSLDDMHPTKEENSLNTSTNSDTNSLDERRKVLENTRAVLEKFSLRRNTSQNSSKLQQSHSEELGLEESTVNESDLLKETQSIHSYTSFKGNHSTNETDLLQQSSLSLTHEHKSAANRHETSTSSISQYIDDLKRKFQASSTASLSDIISDNTRHSFRQSDLNIDSAMFLPAEEFKGQFEDDERAWRAKYASIPTSARASFAATQPSQAFDDKISMGEYFQGKFTDDCSLFGTTSPLKGEPIPLVNSTTYEEDENVNDAHSHLHSEQSYNSSFMPNKSTNSVLSLSDIRELITAEESTPNKVVERLLKPQKKSQTSQKSRADVLTEDYYNSRVSLGSPNVTASVKVPKPYASSADLREKQTLNQSSNKENCSLVSSVRSSSTTSMDSLNGQIIKLASTKNEIVWGCVREGRTVLQDVTIRNKNSRRVKYTIHSNNHNFKLANCDDVIVLHPLETRQLHVAFTPSATGPQTGQLYFTPVLRKTQQADCQRQHVALYAYGGHTNINIKGHTRDLSGKLWLSLGSLGFDGRQELRANFTIRNSGTVDGFIALSVTSKSLCAYEDIRMTPMRVVIRKGQEQIIQVCFRPTKTDLQLLSSTLSAKSTKAAEIAVVRMITGAEINRQRIVKLHRKVSKDYELGDNLQDPILRQLAAIDQPEPNLNPNDDLRLFNESVKSIKPLWQCLDTTEISLLVDRDMDATLMPADDCDENTTLFNTMMSPDDSVLLSEQTSSKFTLEPAKVILTPPTKCADCLFLSSTHCRNANFRVDSSGELCVEPTSGVIIPGEIQALKVSCVQDRHSKQRGRQEAHVQVVVDGEVLSVIVCIMHL